MLCRCTEGSAPPDRADEVTVREGGVHRWSEMEKIIAAYLWSAPSLLLILLIVVFPIIYTGYISLTNMNVYHWFDYEIIGLENYRDALLVFDSGFLQALVLTVVWTAVNMVAQLVIAFFLASLLNLPGLRLRNLYKTLLIFPWAMPGYVSILLWKTGMFNSQFGLLNQWLVKWGLEPVGWLSKDALAVLYGGKPLAGAAFYDNHH